MERNIEKRILEMYGSASVKEGLLELHRAASNSDFNVSSKIANIHLIAPLGSGISTYSRLYADIVKSNNVLAQNSRENLQVLEYEKGQSYEERMKAFQKLVDADGLQNHFWGTVYVDISKWDVTETDLEEFKMLMQFIKENMRNACFIFRSDITSKNAFQMTLYLKCMMNIKQVIMKYPNEIDSFKFALERFKDNGLELQQEAHKTVKMLLAQQAEKSYYQGFSSIARMVDLINYELGILGFAKDRPIDESELMEIYPSIIHKEYMNENKFGFRM